MAVGLALSIATLAIRLRRPRPAWGDLRGQPGFIACLVVIASRFPPCWLKLEWLRIDGPRMYAQMVLMEILSAQSPGIPVAMAWLILKVSGAWHPEVGPVDRLGRDRMGLDRGGRDPAGRVYGALLRRCARPSP